MNIKTLRYYLVPHPLTPGKEILITDGESISKTARETWEFYNNPHLDLPRAFRILVTSEEISREEALKFVCEYEERYVTLQTRAFNRVKLKEFLKLSKGLSIGYLLYLAPPSFWIPIENFMDTVAHGLSDYAKWWVILFFPLKALIRGFGTGIFLRLPKCVTQNPIYRKIPIIGKIQNIGTIGRWNRINGASHVVKIYDQFGLSLENELVRNAELTLDGVERKIELKEATFWKKFSIKLELHELPRHPLVEDLRTLISEFIDGYDQDEFSVQSWNQEFDSILQRATEEARNGGAFPWGEIPKLTKMKEDIIFHTLNGESTFSPLKIIHPKSLNEEIFHGLKHPVLEEKIELSLAIKGDAFQKQAQNLKYFLENEETISIQKKIYENYESLEIATTKEERIEYLRRISLGFEKLRDIVSRFHMGDNQSIPNERGKDLSNFYHYLYLTFGRARTDIEKRYKRVAFGFRPILTKAAQIKRINETLDNVDKLICKDRISLQLLEDTGGKL